MSASQKAGDKTPTAESYRQLQEQNRQLRRILEITRILNTTLNLDTLLNTIIAMARDITATEAASILLLEPSSGELHFKAATGAKEAEVKSLVVPLEGSIAGWIVTHNRPLIVNKASEDHRHYQQVDHLINFSTRSILGVPLSVKNRTIGVIEVVNKAKDLPFTEHDREILETLAAQAAIAIENAQLYKNLQDQIKAREEAQSRLLHTEKLASIGQLVAGIAHELNNPLTSIIGYAQLLQYNQKPGETQSDLDIIVDQARRAAKIVRGLLTFARQHPPEQKPVQINDIINSTLNLLDYELRTHNITWRTHLDPNIPLTMADPNQLQQVFVNLTNNARYAMSTAHGGGELTITTETGPSLLPESLPDQPVIRVIVQDNGPGIPPDILPRIFDPFFTTKSVGEGTGLGMSVCHGIISEHKGHIWAESSPGEGATFFVELPIVAPVLDSTADSPPLLDASTLNSQARILLVDDEKEILTVLTRFLQKAGCRVDAVSNGRAAFPLLEQTDYDLILCDIRMPGISGPEIYRYLQTKNPVQAGRLIFITGDVVNPATQRFLEETGVPCLSKPITPIELLQKLAQSGAIEASPDGIPAESPEDITAEGDEL
ncbi:MAG: response regulator [Caldilineae bacterium]|nr:MAG: response regulator [Caldilineae bacterium]